MSSNFNKYHNIR